MRFPGFFRRFRQNQPTPKMASRPRKPMLPCRGLRVFLFKRADSGPHRTRNRPEQRDGRMVFGVKVSIYKRACPIHFFKRGKPNSPFLKRALEKNSLKWQQAE